MGSMIKSFRKRRSFVALFLCALFLCVQFYGAKARQKSETEINQPSTPTDVLSDTTDSEDEIALSALDQLTVKGRAAKTGYTRSQFGDGWAAAGACDMRNAILARDMRDLVFDPDGCTVRTGTLDDPYTGQTINFTRGSDTSDDVQIDHVVALSDAWQKGAQDLNVDQRFQFANDPLNLLAVEGEANQQKSSSDAASWLPSNKSYRCRYVARQIAVKRKHSLWVTDAEKTAMKRVLKGCEGQPLPRVE